MTLEFIRQELVEGAPLNVEELDKLFQSDHIKGLTLFKEDKRVRAGARAQGSRISGYETAKRDIPFGTLRRYALVSETRTGAIHFVSLFYAFLRCAANLEHDEEAREDQLTQALTTARKLKALALAAETMVNEARKSGLLQKLQNDAWDNPVERLTHGRAVMSPLFAAYREG